MEMLINKVWASDNWIFMGFENVEHKERLYRKSISVCFYEINGSENSNLFLIAHLAVKSAQAEPWLQCSLHPYMAWQEHSYKPALHRSMLI